LRFSNVRIIFGFTFREAIRAKWLIMFSAVFFFLALNVPLLVLLALRYLPPDYLERYLNYLVSLSFPFLPLLSLPVASASVVEERESGALQYVLSGPVSKADFLVGRAVGLLAATTAVVILGYGLAALGVFNVSSSKYLLVGEIAAIGIALNAAMVGLALVISIMSRRKATALGVAVFLWFFFTVLSDLGQLSLAVNLSAGPSAVLPLVITNPVEISRVLAVLVIGGGAEQLGPPGLILTDLLGTSAAYYMLISLASWVTASYAICFIVFSRQDVV